MNFRKIVSKPLPVRCPKTTLCDNNVLTRFYWSKEFFGSETIDEKTKMKALENINELYKVHMKYFEQRRNIHVLLKNAKKA